MAPRSLDVTILRLGRKQQVIHITADINDIPALQGSLKGWLESGRWDKRMWPDFMAEVRFANEWRIQKTVRVP